MPALMTIIPSRAEAVDSVLSPAAAPSVPLTPSAPIEPRTPDDNGAIKEDTTERVVCRLDEHIMTLWTEAKNERQSSGVDDRLTACQRQYIGEYDEKTLAEIKSIGGFDGFRKLTMAKANSAAAWIMDAMADAREKPWGLVPTPIPELSSEDEARIQAQVAKLAEPALQGLDMANPEVAMQARDIMDKMAETMKRSKQIAMMAEARKRTEAMEKLMEDQCDEGGWRKAMEEFSTDFAVFPNAFIKGPFIVSERVLEYGQTPDGKRTLVPVKRNKMRFQRVSPFDMFPGPKSRGVDDSYLFERIYLNYGELAALKLVEGYKKDKIDEVLRDEGTVATGEFSVGNIDTARSVSEGRTPTYTLTSNYKRYEGAIFYGAVPGTMLKEWGLSVNDETLDYEITAVKVAGKVIKAVVNEDPLRRRPFSMDSFKKVPGAFWGMGLPECMNDIQRQMNAVTRALCNNLAIGSGPQLAYDVSQFPGAEKVTTMHPWKVWMYNGVIAPNNRKAVEIIDVPCHAQELLYVYQAWKGEADDVTEIPAFFYGSAKVGGAGNTASGLSMLQDNAQKGIRKVIQSLGVNVVGPCMTRLYYWNMLNSDDDDVKGDCVVSVVGPLAVLTKEATSGNLMQYMQMVFTNPLIMQKLGDDKMFEVLREFLKSRDLDPDKLVPTEEEIRARQREMEAMAMQQPPMLPAGQDQQQPQQQEVANAMPQ